MEKTKKTLYLDNKKKIQALVNEVGYIYLFQYMIEDLEKIEINSTKDLWVMRALEGVEHAYNAYLTRSNIDENNIEMELEDEVGSSTAS